jgi:spore germination protein YaaH
VLLVALPAGAVRTRRHAAAAKPVPPAESPALTRDRARVLNASPLAMFYFASDALGLASLEAHASAMTLLGPQCFELDRAGALRGRVPPGVVEVTGSAGVPLMPLVTNAGFNRSAAHTLLHSPKAQQAAVQRLAELAAHDQYVGWQLDFENLEPADKRAYAQFAARLATRLHRDHRLLSVAVVPRFSDAFPDNSPTAFHTTEWGAAFDFRALGRVADFLVLMAYDEHTLPTAPGPVAGYDWVQAILDYAVRRVPPAKLVLGVPFYGREWVATARGTAVHGVTYNELKSFLEDPASERYWDDLFRTAWFERREEGTVRTVWFDDARSLREKLKLVERYHLRGYAAWRLGLEDPAFWEGSDGE